MANVISKMYPTMVSPMGGKAMWMKVNSTIDEYEGKKRYTVQVVFDDKTTEAKFKKVCDDLLAQAKAEPEFKDKKWRAGNDRCGYKEMDDGSLQFSFQTGAFYKDKDTGEEVQKFIPVLDARTRKKIANDVKFGNGTELRIAFSPMAYWMTRESNGLNLYMNKIVIDKLIEYGNTDDFSEFGIEMASEADNFNEFAEEEDIPV